MDRDRRHNPACQHGFVCFGVVIVFVAAGVGIGLFYLLGDEGRPRTGAGPLVDCGFGKDVGKAECESRDCMWQRTSKANEPRCVFRRTDGYHLGGDILNTNLGYRIKLHRTKGTKVQGKFYKRLAVNVESLTNSIVRIRFSPFNQTQDKVQPLNIPSANLNNTQYRVEFQKAPYFGVRIIRENNSKVIFDTSNPGFLFTENFIQITTSLPSGKLYTLSENKEQIQQDLNWKTLAIGAKSAGKGVGDDLALYIVDDTGEASSAASGVFLNNNNPIEMFLQPDPYPAVTYKVRGGLLDFCIFLGPTRENVLGQFLQVIKPNNV